MKKNLFPLLAAVLLLLLSGCGSSGDSAPGSGSYSPTYADLDASTDYNSSFGDYEDENSEFSNSEPEFQKSEESVFDITAGPILMNGSFGKGFTAAQMNLSTGELEPVFTFTQRSYPGYSFAFNTEKQYYLSSYFSQQLFDENLTKLAVCWLEEADFSQHVGWIDREGNLTDVTKLLHPYTTDFSSKVPHDQSPLFSPDGYFVFTDRNAECYCFFDVDTMSLAKTESPVIDDVSYYGAEFGNIAWNFAFMPDGSLRVLWHTDNLDYGGENEIDFAGCRIALSNSSALKNWDYIDKNIILCIGKDAEGYYIGEIGEGIGKKNLLTGGMHEGDECWNYSYYGSYDKEEKIKITPYTDYYLESCAHSNGQIAFIGSRGNDRFLFTVKNAENSNPVQIAPIDSSWKLLFWK